MSALDDVTPAYVDVVTNYMFTARTSDPNEFTIVRELASTFMNSAVWPYEKYKLGIALLMGHYYTLWGVSAAQAGSSGGVVPGVSATVAGPVTSETVGNVSRSYGHSSSSASSSSIGIPTDWLMLTTFGQQWLLLLKSFKAVPSVTGELFCCPPVKLHCPAYP